MREASVPEAHCLTITAGTLRSCAAVLEADYESRELAEHFREQAAIYERSARERGADIPVLNEAPAPAKRLLPRRRGDD